MYIRNLHLKKSSAGNDGLLHLNPDNYFLLAHFLLYFAIEDAVNIFMSKFKCFAKSFSPNKFLKYKILISINPPTHLHIV